MGGKDYDAFIKNNNIKFAGHSEQGLFSSIGNETNCWLKDSDNARLFKTPGFMQHNTFFFDWGYSVRLLKKK